MTDLHPADGWWAAGCRRECSEQHTYRWGDCALAPESAKPAPTVSISVVYQDTDGHPSIGFDSYTAEQLAELITPALLAPDPGMALPFDEAYARDLALNAAKAIIHRHDPKDPRMTDWTPPPPGDTREQLPPAILALLTAKPYTSTACDTAQRLEQAAPPKPTSGAAIPNVDWYVQMMHTRCRRNQKFTGQLCACTCHGQTDQPGTEETDTTSAATEATGGWTRQDDGTWTLPVDEGTILFTQASTPEDRERFAAAWAANQQTEAASAGLRDQLAAAIWERQNPGRRYTDCEHPWQADAEADADAVLAALTLRLDFGEEQAWCKTCRRAWHGTDHRCESDAEQAVTRVRNECDRLEAAVRDNPTTPDFDGAYLAAIGHVRTALTPPQEPTVTIARRYGSSPAERCTGQSTCPDVLRLDNGDYLVIGKTPGVPNISARDLARHGAGIGSGEQAVVVPAEVLHAAALEITKEQTR